MKKMICFFTLAASLVTFFCLSPRMSVQTAAAQFEAALTHNPEGSPVAVVPAAVPQFPDTIEDEMLLKGLEDLSQSQVTIQLWDGKTITGLELVNFVKGNAIPVVWGSEQICRGSSCSLLYIRDGKYIYEDGQSGVDPIYINPSVKEQKVGRAARLLRELSHEIFHRTRPFGAVAVTQYEEFWAFSVETQLTQAAWPVFTGYDPQDPDSLQQWFKKHNLVGYLKLVAYPEG